MRAILTFHSVDNTGSVISVSPDALRGILDAASQAGYAVLSLDDLLQSGEAEKAIAITFDDGYANLHQLALPILEEIGGTATVFLVSDWVGSAQLRQPSGQTMLSWEQVEELAEAGWELGAHTASHHDLRGLEPAALRHEIDDGAATIAERTGRRPVSFAYPFGLFSESAVRHVRANFHRAVTARFRPLSGGEHDPYLLPRLDAYYFRSPAVYRRFGATSFLQYLRIRSCLRKVRWGRFA